MPKIYNDKGKNKKSVFTRIENMFFLKCVKWNSVPESENNLLFNYELCNDCPKIKKCKLKDKYR